jgi:D-alanyl-D-alanine dipeptidase
MSCKEVDADVFLQLCRRIAVAMLFLASMLTVSEAQKMQNALPSSFVYLLDVDPTIIQDIKYATEDNFTGHPVPGYDAAQCILERSTAEALAKVQEDLRGSNLGLVVFDCFRPKRAVRAFVDWSEASSPAVGTERFYPRIAKKTLFASGYIATTSNHSRGNTVDLTLAQLPLVPPPIFDAGLKYGPCNGPVADRAPSVGVDMGTSFDCFDSKSSTSSVDVSSAQRSWRKRLVLAMERHGFQNYQKEWWHFTFRNSRSQTYFDFSIVEPSTPH